MPIPREILFNEQDAACLETAILRLTGQAAVTHVTRSSDGHPIYVVSTCALDSQELAELRFAVQFARRPVPMRW